MHQLIIQQLKNKTEKGTGGLARHDPLSWPSQKTNYRLATYGAA